MTLAQPVKQASNTIIKQSTCAYCGVGCGVDISVQNNVATSLKGTPEHPANYGRLCIKGTNLLATQNNDNRLSQPQINGEQVTWSTASSYVADKFNDIIAKHGKDAVAFYVSGQLLTEDYYVANKLMKGYIGSGNIDTNSRLCMSSAVAGYKRAFGEDVVPCSYDDLEQTQVLFIVGSNAAWAHPVLYQRIERAKKLNPQMQVVVIDPRRTATAEIADHFLAIKPGTDGAFYNGLLHYLNANNAIDYDYVAQHTEGFALAVSASESWDIATTAQYCELQAEQLVQVYQLFAASEKAISFYSMGINQSSSGVDKCNAIINCHLATGKVAKPGCGPFSITGQPNAMGGREVGGLANQLAAHMDITNNEHRDTVQTFWQSPTMANENGFQAVEMFEKIKSGDIKAVWIMATNPMVSLPNRNEIAAALSKCELVVVSDCVENNDTLAFANVKLPATTWLEKNGTVTNSERRISRQRGIVEPYGEAKHDWQIISEVATKMGFTGFDYQYPSEIFTEHAALSGFQNNGKRLFDISALATLNKSEYDALKPTQWPVNSSNPQGCARVFADNKFSTASGKANFIAITPQLPKQQTNEQFPLLLNSGRIRDQWHTMTRTAKASQLNQHSAKPLLTIHPDDAQKYGVQPDELVTVSALFGEVIVGLDLSTNVRRGECFLPIHWNKQFASSANVSNLYQSIIDPISGQPESKQTPVNIKAKHYQQHVQLHCVDDVKPNADFWLKNNNKFCNSYQLAFTKKLTDELAWTKALNFNISEWLHFTNQQTQQTFIVGLEQNKLVCFAVFSKQASESEAQWLDHIFSVTALPINDISALLQGRASEAFANGKQICSCYAIGEKPIVAAIKQGCSSVEQLGDKLKCGTNCGSCKSELSALIGQHRVVNSAQDSLNVPVNNLNTNNDSRIPVLEM